MRTLITDCKVKVGAKAFIFLTMLLPLQGVYWRLTCTQGAALGCLLVGLTGRSLAFLSPLRFESVSYVAERRPLIGRDSSGMYWSRLQREETVVLFDVPLNAKDASTHSKRHRASFYGSLRTLC